MDLDAVGISTALLVKALSGILISVCQLLALLVIFIGVNRALVIYLKSLFVKAPLSEAFQRSRLVMGYSFSLGLSFLIGATILKTMQSSQWEDIARLAVIIAVRTVLNYLLMNAIKSSSAVPETLPGTSIAKFGRSDENPPSLPTNETDGRAIATATPSERVKA